MYKGINSQLSNKGFTLIELLVVISLLTFLLSVILPSMSAVQQKGRDTSRITTAKQIKNAMDIYWPNNFTYPQPDSGACEDLVGWDKVEEVMGGPIKDPLWPADENFRYCTPNDPNDPTYGHLYGRSYGVLVRLEEQAKIDEGVVDSNGYCKTGIEIGNYPGDWAAIPECNF